jgi:hypothetical protein
MIAGGVESMSARPSSCPRPRRLFARERGLRHHHRLALRQPEDEGRARHRFDARRPPTTWPPTSASAAPTRTPSRCAARPAGPRRRSRALRRRDRAGDVPQRKGEPKVSTATSTPAPDHGRGAGQAARRQRAGPERDGRQCLGRQRRRGGADRRLRGRGAGAGADAARARRRHGGGRAWSRGSWASARCRRCASCWRGTGSAIDQMDVIELNEAFAAQALAVLRATRPARRRARM